MAMAPSPVQRGACAPQKRALLQISRTLQRDLRGVIHFNTMNLLTLTEIRRATQNGTTSARVHVQVENATPKLTREQQPYCELTWPMHATG